MWSIERHFKFIIENNLDEKLYCARDNKLNTYYPSHIIIRAQLSNTLANKTLLIANRIMLERVVGQKIMYIKSKKSHAMFNISKDMQFGFLVHLRSKNMYLFIKNFVMYSLRVIDNFFCILTRKSKIVSINNIKKVIDMLHFGLTKILFFFMISTSKDWNMFSQLYDGMAYGLDMQIQTNSNNPSVNKVMLSHLGLHSF